jgi:hypothetical protein
MYPSFVLGVFRDIVRMGLTIQHCPMISSSRVWCLMPRCRLLSLRVVRWERDCLPQETLPLRRLRAHQRGDPQRVLLPVLPQAHWDYRLEGDRGQELIPLQVDQAAQVR